MSVPKCYLALLISLISACRALPQTAKRACGASGTVQISVADESYSPTDDSYSSTTLAYRISNPNAFSDATVEIWDKPKLLFRKRVPVRATGEVVWKTNEETADTPLALWIQVADPRFPHDSLTPAAMVGTTGPMEGGPVPEFFPESFVLEEGTETPTVTILGTNLAENNTRVLLLEDEGSGVWGTREHLSATLTDLEHVSVQIPSVYLARPAVFELVAVRTGEERDFPLGVQRAPDFKSATIHVMSKDRPVVSGIDPTAASAGDERGAVIRILGTGFTNDSQVLVSERGGMNFSSASKPNFISPNELQVTIGDDQLRAGSSSLGDDFQLWVQNGDNRHVSDPQILTLLPTPEFPLAGTKQPLISSVLPYPVPLLGQSKSTAVLLKIYGENFTSGDTVTVNNGEPNGAAKLKTEFISSQELHAWLTSELWRKHRVSYRLSAQTSSGRCSVEAWEEE